MTKFIFLRKKRINLEINLMPFHSFTKMDMKQKKPTKFKDVSEKNKFVSGTYTHTYTHDKHRCKIIGDFEKNFPCF